MCRPRFHWVAEHQRILSARHDHRGGLTERQNWPIPFAQMRGRQGGGLSDVPKHSYYSLIDGWRSNNNCCGSSEHWKRQHRRITQRTPSRRKCDGCWQNEETYRENLGMQLIPTTIIDSTPLYTNIIAIPNCEFIQL